MNQEEFKPHHINATKDDMNGNNGIGRYIFLPGSDDRAKSIATHFTELEVKSHPRQHNLYLGKLKLNETFIEVASISSGMGAPSLDIIANELYLLGAKRFLRIGTSGSMQPKEIKVGSLIVPIASVRDESTSLRYAPIEVPAVVSPQMLLASYKAVLELGFVKKTYYGTIHSKDSLFAREFKMGPLARQNEEYMRTLQKNGIIASEMECSHLFILGGVLNQQECDQQGVLTGGILSIIGDDTPFSDEEAVSQAIDDSITLGIETIKQLAIAELNL